MNTNLEITYRGRVLLLLGILAAIAAWINKGSSVSLAASILLAPLIIDLLWGGLRLPPMQLVMRRRRTESGAPFRESYTLRNLSTRRAILDLFVREPRTDTYAGGFFIQQIERGREETLKIPARTRSRGRTGQRAVVVVSSYPLGLIRRTAALRTDSDLISEPTRMPLPPHVLKALQQEETDNHSRETLGNDEFHSLRAYQPGHEVRLIHARRSAATGTLISRVMRSQEQREVCVVLDLRRPPGRDAMVGSRRLEWSLGATATIVDAMRERHTLLTCLVIGTEAKIWTLHEPEDTEDFLAYLAEARPVVHRRIDANFLQPALLAEAALWVPAGGFKATEDRCAAENPTLVHRMGALAMTAARREPESFLLLLTLQILCAMAAIGSLPRGAIHPVWIAAFILPAAFFLFLGTGSRRRLIPILLRFVIAGLTQACAAYLASHFVGPLNEKSSLACSLLPALTYFTLRREPSDSSLSLFLSFCFLLIGIMLNGDSADWTLLVYLFCCAWALQIEAGQRALTVRHAVRGSAMAMSTRVLRRLQVVGALMIAAFFLHLGLSLLPAPGRTQTPKTKRAANHSNSRSVGLSTRFDLSGAEGAPVQLSADKTILVTAPSAASEVPTDLYLRMTYFDRGGVNEWTTWPSNTVEKPLRRGRIAVWQPAGRDRRLPRFHLKVDRLEPAENGELFIPPGAEIISKVPRMRFDLRLGAFQATGENADMGGYEVRYRRPHKVQRPRRIDRVLTAESAFRDLPLQYRNPKPHRSRPRTGWPKATQRRSDGGGSQDRGRPRRALQLHAP